MPAVKNLREFHREFFNALCDVFGDSVNVLLRMTVKESGLDRNKAGTLLRFIDNSTCIDIEEIVGEFEETEFTRDDAMRMMHAFFKVTDDVLGEATIALVKLIVRHLRKYYGDNILEVLERIFGNIATMEVEESDGVIRFYFRPRMKDAYKHMPMYSGIPFPALIYIAAKLGDRFKITKFEHVENRYCLVEVTRL